MTTIDKIEELLGVLNDFPNQISELQLNLIELNHQLKEVNSKLIDKTAEIKAIIQDQLDDDRKKLYSNAEARETAFVIESKSNPEYCEIHQNASDLQRQIQKTNIEIEKLQNQQRNTRIVITALTSLLD